MALVTVISCEQITPTEESKGTITVTPAEHEYGHQAEKDYQTLTRKSDSKQ